jgi:hypothetical protein
LRPAYDARLVEPDVFRRHLETAMEASESKADSCIKKEAKSRKNLDGDICNVARTFDQCLVLRE